jgi:transcriptional regulator with XRE-family HTH domain
MKSRRARAVDYLMSCTPEQTAEALGVRIQTLEQWMKMDDFKEALRAREREDKRSLARIARRAAINAAQTLSDIAADRTKPDVKVLLEIVKASGAFEKEAEDANDGLDEIIRRLQGDEYD